MTAKATPKLRPDLDNEEWRSLQEYKNYHISSSGKIWSSKGLGRFLRPRIEPSGYQYVILRVNGTSITRRIHRLVAMAFITPQKHKYHINHIDGNKFNNHYTNLEWCTPKENLQHARKEGLNKGNPKIPIIGTVIATGQTLKFESATDAERSGLGDQANIRLVCIGKRSHCKGIIWRYDN